MNPQAKTTPAPGDSVTDDPSIPVLTERLTLPPLEFDTTLPPELRSGERMAPFEGLTAMPATVAPAPAAPAPAVPPSAEPPPASAVTVIGRTSPPTIKGQPPEPTPAQREAGGHWARIEIELRSSILRDLAQQLPQEVEAIVRSHMNDAIDQLVDRLAAETRLALAASLHEIVEHAVRAELTRLRAKSKG